VLLGPLVLLVMLGPLLLVLLGPSWPLLLVLLVLVQLAWKQVLRLQVLLLMLGLQCVVLAAERQCCMRGRA
jgi:hypothetical protein